MLWGFIVLGILVLLLVYLNQKPSTNPMKPTTAPIRHVFESLDESHAFTSDNDPLRESTTESWAAEHTHPITMPDIRWAQMRFESGERGEGTRATYWDAVRILEATSHGGWYLDPDSTGPAGHDTYELYNAPTYNLPVVPAELPPYERFFEKGPASPAIVLRSVI